MVSFNKSGETKSIATYTSCISGITVSDPNNWGNTYTANNGTVSLTVPSNSSSARSETITISYSANTTSCSKTLEISQEGGATPIPIQYRWVNSGTTCVGVDKYQRQIKQQSEDGGTTWTNVSPETYSATTLIEANSEDCGYIPPTGCTPFLDSCCQNNPNHRNYDIHVDGEQGQAGGADSMLSGCTYHVSTTLPSWLGIRIDTTNEMIWYDAEEANDTGAKRACFVDFVLDSQEAGNNYCSESTVIVEQLTDGTSGNTMNVIPSVYYGGSDTVTVTGISFVMADGTFVTSPFSTGETFTSGQTITRNVDVPTIYNNETLLSAHPVILWLDDNTYVYGTCTSSTISAYATLSISFS